MNWGDHPVVNKMLESEYNAATTDLSLDHVEMGTLEIGKDETLSSLRDRGVNAQMLSTAHIPWKKAVRRFGVRSMLEFGLNWEMASNMSITCKDLEFIGIDNLISMGAFAQDLAALEITHKQLVALNPTVDQLKLMKFTEPLFAFIGTTKDNMSDLGIDEITWREMDPYWYRTQEITYDPTIKELPTVSNDNLHF